MSARVPRYFPGRAISLLVAGAAATSCGSDATPRVVELAASGGSAGSLAGSSGAGTAGVQGGHGATSGAPLGGTQNGGASAGGASGSSGSSAGAGVAGALLCTPPAAAQICDGTVPQKQTLLAFATYAADGTWGLASVGDLTGGTSKFQAQGVEPLVLAVQGRDATAALRVSGVVPVGAYAGFVLWFGPCVNAATITNAAEIAPSGTVMTSATTGIAFGLGGTLGGSVFKLQVQTHANYPTDADNAKGGCVYSSCATRWTDCSAPTRTLTEIPLDPVQTAFPWTSFGNGKPVASTNGDGIVGLQFQFECVASAACAIDLRIATITFTR